MLVGPEERPDLSVVMVLWNAAPFLRACLEPLASSPIPIEVLALDNASTDGSAALAAELGALVTTSPTNLGFPRAVNELLPAARGAVTLLLNPDVALAPDALSQALTALEPSGVGMVGINLRRPDGQADPPAARRFRSVGTILVESLGLGLLVPRLDVQYLPGWDRRTDRDVPCINGAFMLLPTATLRAVGGLDDTVFLYLEDQELCRQVHDRGERIRFVADALATHVGGGSTEAASPEQRAVAYLHRLDASLEIVRRRQGSVARLAALAILTARSASQLGLATVRGRADRVVKHRQGLRWLRSQWTGRRPPPPVP